MKMKFEDISKWKKNIKNWHFKMKKITKQSSNNMMSN